MTTPIVEALAWIIISKICGKGLLNLILGAVTGQIAANDPLGGGLGAAFAEISMEAMTDAKAESNKIMQENPGIEEPEFKQIFQERIMARRFFSQVIGGFTSALAGSDFNVASNAAAIALDYNMLPSLMEVAMQTFDGVHKETDAVYAILQQTGGTPASKAELVRVLRENPELGKVLLSQQHAGSLRISAYRTIANANDYLNNFAQANPALAHYAVKGLEFAGSILHGSAYVVAAIGGGQTGVATLFAIEQAVGKSLEAAIEISANHAAQSASSPAEEHLVQLQRMFISLLEN